MPAPSTCTVSGVLYGPTASPVEGVKVKVYVTTAFTDDSGNYIPAGLLASTTSDEDGAWSLAVIRTADLGRSVTFQFEYPLGNNQSASVKYAAVIPDAASAEFSDLVDLSTGAAIIAQNVTTDSLAEGITNLYFTEDRARAAFSFTAPITETSGTVAMPAADASTDGYLTKEDWAQFNLASAPPVTSVNSEIGAVVLDTDDVDEGDANLYYTDDRADARVTAGIAAQKGAVNGIASLGASGVIPSAQLPAVAITDTFVVSDEAEMLALTAEIGDVAVREDESKSYILQAEPASILANWIWLKSPAAGSVDSVNGQTGTVSLDTGDINESGNLYFTDSRAKTATVLNTLAGSETDQAPSVSAVNSALGGKQATGNYITSLTGDVTASGPGAASAALATVNSNVGSFTNANITVNAKGLITAASSGSGGSVPNSFVRVRQVNGQGSTSTAVLRFTATEASNGSDITYADSSTLGGTFTINTTGLYSVVASTSLNGSSSVVISKNASQLTTDPTSMTTSQIIGSSQAAADTLRTAVAFHYFTATDVIRIHANTGVGSGGTNGISFCTVTRIA